MVVGSSQEENITVLNIYVPNNEAPKCIMHVLTDIKREIDSNTIVVMNFNIPLISRDKSLRKQ